MPKVDLSKLLPQDRYRKQVLFAGLQESGQQKLQSSSAVVIGCGALGSVIVDSLVRAGVGHVRIVDRDLVEFSNLQRQVLFDENDVFQKLPKAIAASAKLMHINSDVAIEPIVADVTHENILQYLDGVDCILDGTDNFETRFLINDAACKTEIPWVHGGCVGSHGQVMTVLPGKSPCLRCLMPEIPEPGTTETCDTAGVIAPAVNVIASFQVVGALKVLSGQQNLIRPELQVLDVWEGTLRTINLADLLENPCPCCRSEEHPWLDGSRGAQSTVLCGRNAVQISPEKPIQLSLPELSSRLRLSGTVKQNAFLVSFQPADEEFDLTIFSNGRAIIVGTEEIAIAKGVYSRYVGI